MARPNAFDGMMHEFCVGLGFCGGIKDGDGSHVTQFVPEAGLVTAEEFARWLVIAEGLDPDQNQPWLDRLKTVFLRHMGAEAVDASQLRSDYRDA